MRPMALWAHRGGGKGPLENTLEGFEKALNRGFNAVEFDVMVSCDGVLYVHHDACLGRVSSPPTNVELPSQAIAELHSEQLDLCLAAEKSLLRFDSLARWLHKHQLVANVELKASSLVQAKQVGLAVKNWLDAQTVELKRYASEKWIYSSFMHSALLPLIGQRLAVLYDSLPSEWIIRADALEAEAVHLGRHDLNETQVYRIHTSGRQVRVFTVNDADEVARLQQMGVDGVFTDNLGLPTLSLTS